MTTFCPAIYSTLKNVCGAHPYKEQQITSLLKTFRFKSICGSSIVVSSLGVKASLNHIGGGSNSASESHTPTSQEHQPQNRGHVKVNYIRRRETDLGNVGEAQIHLRPPLWEVSDRNRVVSGHRNRNFSTERLQSTKGKCTRRWREQNCIPTTARLVSRSKSRMM